MKLDLASLKQDKGAWNIILWNITPFLGVIFLHWAPLSVFVYYSLETIVIGIFNIFRLIAVYYYGRQEDAENNPGNMGILAIPAFAFAYGLAAWVQLISFMSIAGLIEVNGNNNLVQAFDLILDQQGRYILFGLFVVSNAYAFVNDFILPGEYAKRNMTEQMAEPFIRVIASQAAVLVGAALFVMFGNLGLLVCFAVIKTFFDLYLRKYNAAIIIGWE